MVIMRREDITAVVLLTLHFCNDVEALVIFQEFVVHIRFHSLHSLDCLRRYPDDGLIHHTMTVSLKELDR